jgi:hypothetical protein
MNRRKEQAGAEKGVKAGAGDRKKTRIKDGNGMVPWKQGREKQGNMERKCSERKIARTLTQRQRGEMRRGGEKQQEKGDINWKTAP